MSSTTAGARRVGGKVRRPQAWNIDAFGPTRISDLFGVGRDDDLVEPLLPFGKAYRPSNQGNAEKAFRVLAGQAFRTTASRNDSQRLQVRPRYRERNSFSIRNPTVPLRSG